MIETFSEAVAKKLKQLNPEETRSVEVMKYGLAMSLNLILSVGCSLVIGYLTNRVEDTLEAIIAFAALRRVSGGVHAPNLTVCFLISLLIFTAIPLLGSVVGEWFILVATAASIILVLVYAHTDYSGPTIYVYKALAVLLVVAGVFYQSSSVTLAMFAQAILLIRRR